jgi:alpha-glucosidase (family GH31 glycosyl hydrolase)
MIGESLLATPLYGADYATADSRDVYLPEGRWMDYESGEVYEGPLTLEDFPLPLEKTPLFVGGKGVVVEQKEGKIVARVYPLANNVEMVFTDKDGETKSRISIGEPNWEQPKIVKKTEGVEVTFKKVNHAFEFVLEQGDDYQIN